MGNSDGPKEASVPVGGHGQEGGGTSGPGVCDGSEPSTGELGTIVGFRGGLAEVRVGVQRCQGCGNASTCSLFLPGQATHTILARPQGAVRVGERVAVRFSGSAKVKTAFLLYLCPSISTLLGAVLGAGWFSGVIGVSPSVGGLVMVLLLLPIGLAPGYLANRRGQGLPVISEILKED